MTSPLIPTPQDTQLLMQDVTTRTATFNTPGMNLGNGYAPGGLGRPVAAVINVTALDVADGNENYAFVLQESADNVTFAAVGTAVTVSAVGVAVAKGRSTKRYARLALTAGGTSPSITFKAWLNPLP